jgi:hypothetical protein
MMHATLRIGLLGSLALALTACASSSRIQSGWVGPPSATARIDAPRSPVFNAPAPVIAQAPVPEPAPPIASSVVTTEPLAPPPGARAAIEPLPAPVEAMPVDPGPAVADVPLQAPPVTASLPSQASAPPPSGPIDLRPRGSAPVAAGGGGRSTVLGGWTARDATGSVCRVVLSSSPALDLYKASAGSCQNRDLSRVSAWDYRDGEVYLYQPGGTVAARLRTGGSGLEGALAKSGAPLTFTR